MCKASGKVIQWILPTRTKPPPEEKNTPGSVCSEHGMTALLREGLTSLLLAWNLRTHPEKL